MLTKVVSMGRRNTFSGRKGEVLTCPHKLYHFLS
jgi:hypothetical protein